MQKRCNQSKGCNGCKIATAPISSTMMPFCWTWGDVQLLSCQLQVLCQGVELMGRYRILGVMLVFHQLHPRWLPDPSFQCLCLFLLRHQLQPSDFRCGKVRSLHVQKPAWGGERPACSCVRMSQRICDAFGTRQDKDDKQQAMDLFVLHSLTCVI